MLTSIPGGWSGPALAQEQRFHRIATGSTAGTYFPIAALIANAISNPAGGRACEEGGRCGVPGLIAAAVTSQGAVENLSLLRRGMVESAFVQADVALAAYRGRGRFKDTEPFGKLRLITNLYPESIHVVVRADTGIRGIAGLRGKRVSLGLPESGTLIEAQLVLEAHGLSETAVQPEYWSPSRSADQLAEGNIDAFFFVAGAPAGAIAGLATRIAIDLLPIEPAVALRLTEQHPYLSLTTIPDGTYANLPARVVLSVGAHWVTSADLDAEFVYLLTRALWHPANRALLDRGHPNGRLIRLESALDGAVIPLHEGAERFYREVGRLK
ncbi:MAG: TAXI family TRAP transporter solute-binding subunit [Alphaproteobacteria bacterium]|nr:TAXI family TRAP transporter solute-binding subunit [Alphaproteobacteria bacterium]